MAPRKHPNYKSRPKYTWQDSTFLSLPREIRDLIYPYALTRDTPIDLWPGKVLSDDTIKDTPSLLARQKKRVENPLRHEHQRQYATGFRDQQDLVFVRKQLAVGLLSTCTLVYDEAWHHWWSNNTFKFSHDSAWEGLRRFLTTIGPRARKQLRHLHVYPIAPISEVLTWDEQSQITRKRYKNHPKMRMTKVVGMQYTTENSQYVVELLKSDGPSVLLKGLHLVVPRQNYIMASALLDNPIVDDLLWLTHVVVFEPESSFYTDWPWNDALEILRRRYSVDVICQPGTVVNASVIDETSQFLVINDVPPISLAEKFVFSHDTASKELAHMESLLIGLPELFAEPEELQSNTTRLKSSSKGKQNEDKTMSRVLKGFGGCRFESKPLWLKYGCFQINDTLAYDEQLDSEDMVNVVFVAPKNPQRAFRMGVINDPHRRHEYYNNRV
jgi:hypothetical protein